MGNEFMISIDDYDDIKMVQTMLRVGCMTGGYYELMRNEKRTTVELPPIWSGYLYAYDDL